jgi:ankyrin repeat protein
MLPWTEREQQLVEAIRHWDENRIRVLLAQGANLNRIHPGERETPLATAISEWTDVKDDVTERVATLIRLGADPNAGDARGLSPLVYAIWKMDVPVLKLLLESGADPNIVSGFDEVPETALDFVFDEHYLDPDEATQKVLRKMETLLRQHGAKTYSEGWMDGRE